MAFPTPVSGAVGVGDLTATINANQLWPQVIDVSDTIALLDPNENPFTSILLSIGNKKPAVNPLFNVVYDVLNPEYFSVTTTAATTATSITLDDASGLRIGDILAHYKVGSIKPEAEQVLVTNISSNTVTLLRQYRMFSGTTRSAFSDESVVHVIGTVKGDKSTYSDLVTYDTRNQIPLQVVNYCQLFSRVVPMSRVDRNTDVYGTDDNRAYLRRKAMVELKRQIENAFLWGVAGKDSSVSLTGPAYAGNVFTTGGFYSWVTQGGTNYSYPSAPGYVQDQTDLSSAEFRAFLRNGFRYGSPTKWLFASPYICEAIESWMVGDLRLAPGEDTFGVKARKYLTTWGEVNIVQHKMLESLQLGNTAGPLQLASAYAGSQAGNGGCAFLVDMDDVRVRYLQNMDLQMEMDVGLPGDEVKGDKISGMLGLELRTPAKHAILRNVATYSA